MHIFERIDTGARSVNKKRLKKVINLILCYSGFENNLLNNSIQFFIKKLVYMITLTLCYSGFGSNLFKYSI